MYYLFAAFFFGVFCSPFYDYKKTKKYINNINENK